MATIHLAPGGYTDRIPEASDERRWTLFELGRLTAPLAIVGASREARTTRARAIASMLGASDADVSVIDRVPVDPRARAAPVVLIEIGGPEDTHGLLREAKALAVSEAVRVPADKARLYQARASTVPVGQIILTVDSSLIGEVDPRRWTIVADDGGEWHHVAGPAPLLADDAGAMDTLLGRDTQ